MELALGRTVMMQQAPGVAASSECSSGCQSGWTTYLDDDDDDGDRSSSRSSSCGTNRHFARAKAAHQFHCHDRYSCSEEDDLSMISDASSGPRHHQKCSNDAGQAGGAAASSARRRVADAAATRRQSKKAAAAALLEDTASSPAFLGYSKQATHLFEEATSVYGYGAGTDEPMMMEMANAADFSCAFSATTTAGFKSPLNGTALDGYLQMQYSPAAAKTMMHTAQVCRDAGETTQRW